MIIPIVAMVDGRKAVVFDGDDLLKANQNAPAEITGNNPYKIIYTVWNESIASDEEVFYWAKRGTNNRHTAVCYGSNSIYGAVAHWGTSADMGFDRGVPQAHSWHTIAVTYQGGTNGAEYVLTNGQINSNEIKTLDIWPNNPMTVGSAYDGDPDVPPGTITPVYFFSGALAKLEVYNVYVRPANLAMIVTTPVNINGDFIIDFRDVALFANNWMAGPVLLGN